jgi:ankyrin repeat protein
MDIDVRAGAEADFPGFTPLHFAARFTQFPMVAYLVEHGAAINVRDKHGATPLSVAFDPRVRAYLISAGGKEPQQIASEPSMGRP